ncbi:hypothetical protein [Gimesia aquarii]|uniref:Uncharacterized protein n=1 Tax=Gimesia aquarii TaxID=2527964 RepID=A0A517WTV4_9PLAN|nr:hypothetical protein [Gimesia aquarii]QDU08671.1 hypothetical protein V202x_20410 [Gimesia aquarii]
MPIEYLGYDPLPHISKQPVQNLMGSPQTTASAPSPQFGSTGGSNIPLGAATDLSGCVSLIGPLQVCWELSTSNMQATVMLKILGATIATGTISKEHPCVMLSGGNDMAKAELKLCLVDLSKIVLSGKACAFETCKSFEIVLVSW